MPDEEGRNPEQEPPREDVPPRAPDEEPTEPTAEPTEPTAEPTEPTAEATEPTAEAPQDEPDDATVDVAPEAGEQQASGEPPADVAPEVEAEQTADVAPEVEAERPGGGETPPARRQRGGRRDRGGADHAQPETIPGAHLEPDLVLDEAPSRGEALGERSAAEIEAAEAAFAADEERPPAEAEAEVGAEPASVPATVLELAADARYRATGKRKSAVARVTLRPGTGIYTINGRELDRFFPRPTLQRVARGPLETVGHEERMDVVATIHGGGVSAQAGALRHGVARALVEADPALRSELKRRGYLTRDPRVKERKKAGLKKARKRPQFSKR
jgi:small subunit ribosomal protein S9